MFENAMTAVQQNLSGGTSWRTAVARFMAGIGARSVIAIAWLVIPLPTAIAESPGNGEVPPSLMDVSGESHRPFEDSQVQAVVLAFVVTDCPIANSYAPELNRLHADYHDRGVELFLVQVDPELSVEDAREHAREYELQLPIVLDDRHAWVERVGATITPEAAVLSPAGEVLYLGRIDDRYAALGKRREQVTANDLRAALDAILAGRPVPKPRTKAIGCHIPDLPKQK